MDTNGDSNKGLKIAIGAGLILAIAIVASSVLMSRPTGPNTTGAATTGSIQYAVTPLSVSRSADEKITVEAEVVREDTWDWQSVSVQNVSVTGHSEATAKLTSTLPTDPIPERFTLTFLCDAVDGGGSHLGFELHVKAAKHVGLSNASGTRTCTIPLEPASSNGE